MAFDIYGLQHPLLKRTDAIDVEGYNGDRCRISGPGCRDDWGPLLAPASTGFWDAPFKTNWGPGIYGQKFSSWSPQRRDVVFTVHILAPTRGLPIIDSDPDLWHSIYSRWKAMWSQQWESTIIYTSVDGERRLKARLLETPKAFGSQSFEGKDPHIFPYGSIVMPVACENPYYVGEPYRFAYEWNGNGNHWFQVPFFNPATIDVWPEWWGTDRAAYVFPDWSWGSEEYGRGRQDEGKVLRVPNVPGETIPKGGNFHAMTRPDEETFRTEEDLPLGNNMNGADFEYPIPAGAGDAPEFDDDGKCINGAVVRIMNCTNPDGSRVELEIPRYYGEPFGTARVF